MKILRDAAGYGIASACALAVDMSILSLLVHVAAWDYLIAATASFLCGAVVAYFLSVRLVFKQHRLRDRRAEFVSFLAIGTVGLGVNALVLMVCVGHFGLRVEYGKAVAAGFTFICNFLLRRQLLFVVRPMKREIETYVQD